MSSTAPILALAIASACSRTAPPPPASREPAIPEARPATAAPTSRPVDPTPPAPTASAIAPPPPTFEEPPSRRLPVGFVVPEGPEFGCGNLRIEQVADASSGNEPYVRVKDASGKLVYQAQGRQYSVESGAPQQHMSLTVEWCGDLTGDAVPELALAERTMGAHCCYTYYVVSLSAPPKRLLMWEKGDGGHGMLPVKLRPGAAHQVLSWDVIMPPFDVNEGDPVLSYATTPSFPIVFELSGGKYVKRTFSFKEGLAKRRAQEREECRSEPQQCRIDELLEWGYGLIIGDWEAEKERAVPDEALRERLDARSAAMRRLLVRRLGR